MNMKKKYLLTLLLITLVSCSSSGLGSPCNLPAGISKWDVTIEELSSGCCPRTILWRCDLIIDTQSRTVVFDCLDLNFEEVTFSEYETCVKANSNALNQCEIYGLWSLGLLIYDNSLSGGMWFTGNDADCASNFVIAGELISVTN